jgi:hypothetical protein
MLLCAALLITMIPAAALAAGAPIEYIDANGDPANTGSTPVTVINEYTETFSSGWYVVNGDVTLYGPIPVTGDVHLIIEDGSSLAIIGSYGAGLNVSGSNSLTIYGQAQSTGKLTVTGDDYCAGIGGGEYCSGGNITINGGTITAAGGAYAAGIGGGGGGSGGNITINGGTVTATGYNAFTSDRNGAGIGGGDGGSGGIITINGGMITAAGGNYSAGIGGGFTKDGGMITINGGTVSAKGGNYSAGIGGGYSGERGTGGSGGTITVNGGAVTVLGGNGGAGIGGGYKADGGTITVKGGMIKSTGGDAGAGIGGGGLAGGGNIAVNGGIITAAGGSFGASIGGGYLGGGGNIAISGGTVTATSGNYGSGIGGGGSGSGGMTAISGGTVTATGADYGAGIGGGHSGGGGSITISGGTVTATSNRGPGVGGGYNGSGGTTVISGGTVKASSIQASPTNGPGNGSMPVYLTTVTLNGLNSETAITQMASSAAYYGIKDMKTDSAGKLYLYLPAGTEAAAAQTASARYARNTIPAGSQGILYLPALAVTGDAAGFTFGDNGALTFTGSGSYFISGSSSTIERIVVAPGVTADITLSGVNIDLSQSGGCAFDMAGAAVNLTLAGENSLISGGTNAGLHCPDGASLTIGGAGTLTTAGGSQGAGIGGSGGESCGSIGINSGTVYSAGGDGAKDIGSGANGSGGTLTLSGTAQVFLRNDSCIEPVTETHTRQTFTEDADEVYGIPVPSAWAPPFGAYLRVYTLSYSVNNGTGTAPNPITKLYCSTETVADGSGLTRTGYTFGGWNTQANGGGTAYAPGEMFTFTADTALFARWRGISNPESEIFTVSYHPNGGTGDAPSDNDRYYTGDKVFLKPGSGLVRAGYVFEGWSLTPDGLPLSDPYMMGYRDVTLFAVWQSENVGTPPKTGDGTSILGFAMITAALAVVWAAGSRRVRRKT